MSYGITFINVPEEEMKDYKHTRFSNPEETLEFIKFTIIEDCMKYKEKFDGKITGLIKDLRFCLRQIAYMQKETAEADIYDDWNSESEYSPKDCINIEGSRFRDRFSSDDNDDVVNYCLEQLVMYGALIDTPNYWEDSEKWSNLYGDIDETIDYCKSQCYDNTIMDIKDKLYKYSDEYADIHRDEMHSDELTDDADVESKLTDPLVVATNSQNWLINDSEVITDVPERIVQEEPKYD